ncbi:MAG: SDR family NAD(P)-dependent oxidoreductase [Dehalococcoidia bacterium]|nr:SDR family NAD(P)-dependent oxidoreductase [Dehalococcoidia bacterium]
MRLRDHVAVVTGASRGIGRAAALALAREGAAVVCAARSSEAASSKLPGTIEETARQVEAAGGSALAVACDLTQEREVERLAQRTFDHFGRADILINNAAVNSLAPFAETSPKRWDLIMNVNLRGTALCTQAFLPRMIEQGSGRIVNVSSGAVTEPHLAAELGIIPYAVSKAAVEALTEALAFGIQHHGVAVNCLRIETSVATEGARLMNPKADVSDWEEPEAVAEALLWLATREPSYTGRVVTLADVRAER